METIIGRKPEITLLAQVLTSKHAEFVAVYGRRRVGKTYLIKNFFANKKVIFFHVTGIKDGLLEAQLERFAQVLSQIFYKDITLRGCLIDHTTGSIKARFVGRCSTLFQACQII